VPAGGRGFVIEPGQIRPEYRARHRIGAALEPDLLALGPALYLDRRDVGAHQRLEIGVVIVPLGDDFGLDLVADLPVGAEMGKRRIAAKYLAVMQAHDTAAECIVDAVLNLVEPVQHRKFPKKKRKPISGGA
jgi:hypothetical protein